MQLPSSLYGRYEVVKARCRRIVTDFVKGKRWEDAVGTHDTVSVESVAALIVLNGPSPLLGGEPRFHCYLPLLLSKNAIAEGRLPHDTESELFAQSLQTIWGILGLLSPANLMWVYPPQRHQPFLEAVLHFWEALDHVGRRYTTGLNTGNSLWNLDTNLKYVLAKSGVPTRFLNEALPAGGLTTLSADWARKRNHEK